MFILVVILMYEPVLAPAVLDSPEVPLEPDEPDVLLPPEVPATPLVPEEPDVPASPLVPSTPLVPDEPYVLLNPL